MHIQVSYSMSYKVALSICQFHRKNLTLNGHQEFRYLVKN